MIYYSVTIDLQVYNKPLPTPGRWRMLLNDGISSVNSEKVQERRPGNSLQPE